MQDTRLISTIMKRIQAKIEKKKGIGTSFAWGLYGHKSNNSNP